MISDRFQSAYWLLLIAFLIICSCDSQQENQTAKNRSLSKKDMFLLPSNEQLINFRRITDPFQFSPGNFADVIGDNIDQFLDYGVVSMVMADYKDNSEQNQYIVQLFRFPDCVSAFGLYSQLRRLGLEFLPIGIQGFLSTERLYFLKDRFVISVGGQVESNHCRGNIIRLASVTEANIDGHTNFPNELDVFPSNNRVMNSEQYFKNGFLFDSNKAPVFCADYNINENRVTVFYVPSDGTESLTAYLRYIVDHGKIFEEYQSQGLLRYILYDPLHSSEIIYEKNNRYIGAMGSIDFTHFPEFINDLREVVE